MLSSELTLGSKANLLKNIVNKYFFFLLIWELIDILKYLIYTNIHKSPSKILKCSSTKSNAYIEIQL